MNPSSRGGQTNEFNLFPYRAKSHNRWHELFLNMTIWEVWDQLEEIHCAIFLTDDETITRPWLSVCKLPSKADLRNHLGREYCVEDLQDAWETAFGGWELIRARIHMKHMMLFMVFGSDAADHNRIFNNGNLTEFFEQYPLKAEGQRKWAFQICFGADAGLHQIKSKTSKILRQSP